MDVTDGQWPTPQTEVTCSRFSLSVVKTVVAIPSVHERTAAPSQRGPPRRRRRPDRGARGRTVPGHPRREAYAARLTAGIILAAPAIFRIPGLRYPLIRSLEFLGGAALIVRFAEALRDWEHQEPIMLDLP
jgi:hypothetical protein